MTETARDYPRSRDMLTRLRSITPGGAQTMSKMAARFVEGAYPGVLKCGEGARVVDQDWQTYVDWICGLGAISLGYAHPGVSEAIAGALEDGLICPSLPTELEAEVAEKLVRAVGSPEWRQPMVRFTKTGSEACAGAVRIARRATRRDPVLVVGYHGWHDWVQVTSPWHDGIPDVYGWVTQRMPYNDVDRIREIMRIRPYAAVMLEPTLLTPPAPGYLEALRELCTDHGALLIFDEMVCGFRWAIGGGGDYYKVTPDLAVYGKALANGMPLAAIVGPAATMRYADVISGTFGGEMLSLAAAGAVLDAYAKEDHTEAQWARGWQFLQWCEDFDIPVTGAAVHPKIMYKGHDMAVFLQETAARGVLLHPGGCNVSAALNEEDLQITKAALQGAAEAVRAGVPLRGIPPQPGPFERTAS